MTATEPTNILTQDTDLVVQSCAKLYMKPKRSDVCFVFLDDDGSENERIPAHKLILAAGSDVFDAMFYGPLHENNEVKIVDSTASAFKEFLQFFYRGKLQLTSENLPDVANLCKKYQVDDALKICETLIKSSISIDEMCCRYGIAKHLDLDDLRNYCHEKIQENTPDILKSASFLASNHALVGEIMGLLSRENYANEIVNGYMEWAKAECTRKNLETNSVNLRAQLGDLYDQMPFDKMTMGQFSYHTVAHSGFFNVNEIETIIQSIVNNQKVVECDRRSTTEPLKTINRNQKFHCEFSINRKVLMTQFYCNIARSCTCEDIRIRYLIVRLSSSGKFDKISTTNRFTLFRGITEMQVVLPEPILINANIKYLIKMRITPCCVIDPNYMKLKRAVQLDNGILIKFSSNKHLNDCVSRLEFSTNLE